MILVDTSVWIEVFRRTSFSLEEIVDLDEILTCLPIVQEVLQGFNNQAAYERARESMLAFPIVESPLRQEVYLEAVEIFRAARRVGLTLRSTIDVLIAACALRNDVTVLHKDRDYDVIARFSTLRTARI